MSTIRRGLERLTARVGLLIGAVAWCLAALALVQAAGRAWSTLRSPAPDLDAALGGVAAVVGLGALGWTALASVCVLAASVLPAGSAAARRAARIGERITPSVLRRLLAVAVGAALVSGAAPAPPAPDVIPGRMSPVAATLLASPPTPVAGPLDPGWAAPTDRSAPHGRAYRTPGDVAALAPGTVADLDPGWPLRPVTTTATAARPVPSRPTNHAPDHATDHAANRSTARAAPALDPTWGPAGRLRPGASPETAVVVRRGDTLWDVAARRLGPDATDAEIAASWPHWFTANRAVIGPDPDALRPGQRLIPPTTGGAA